MKPHAVRAAFGIALAGCAVIACAQVDGDDDDSRGDNSDSLRMMERGSQQMNRGLEAERLRQRESFERMKAAREREEQRRREQQQEVTRQQELARQQEFARQEEIARQQELARQQEVAKQLRAKRVAETCPPPPSRRYVDSDLGEAYRQDHVLAVYMGFVLANCYGPGDTRASHRSSPECQQRVAACKEYQAIVTSNQRIHNNDLYVADIQGGWLGEKYPGRTAFTADDYDMTTSCSPDQKKADLERLQNARSNIARRHNDVMNTWNSWYVWAGRVAIDCAAKVGQ